MDTESRFYDSKFSAKILKQNNVAEVVTGTSNQKSVLVSNSVDFYSDSATTLLTGYGATCTASVGAIGSSLNKQTYVYTSPQILMTFGSNARMGPEYSCTLNGTTMLESSECVFLVRSMGAPTIASVYDPCLFSSSIFDIADMGDYTAVVERSVDDSRWAFGYIPYAPTSDTAHFLVGEYPYRSEGSLVFLPPLESLVSTAGMNIKDGSFAVPNGTLPVILDLAVVENGNVSGTFKLYPSAGQQGKPAYEVSLGELSASATGVFSLSIPTKTYGSYTKGGGLNSIVDVMGCKTGTVISGSLKPYVNTALVGTMQEFTRATYSDLQVSNISELTFPVKANSVTAVSDCTSGNSLLAYEIDGRIDLAFRSAHFGPYIPLRDVVLRVPNEGGTSDGKSLPSAVRPVLMSDINTRTLSLFYLYKNRLLVKKIPEEVLADLIGKSTTFTAQPEKEAESIKRLHMINSSVIYEAVKDDQSIISDLKAGSVRKIVNTTVPDTTVPASSDGINEYCVFSDQVGYIYAVIQTTKQLYIFRSYNGGDIWENLIPNGFSFYPPTRVVKNGVVTQEQNKPSEIDAAIPQYPFVMVDWASQNGNFFYFVDDNLLLFTFPVEILRESKSSLPDKLTKYISPQVVVGQLTFDMAQRGITYSNTELSKKNPPMKAIPQKVTGVITHNGAYRVFFRDSNGILRSIVSLGLGSSWLLDEDIKDVKDIKP